MTIRYWKCPQCNLRLKNVVLPVHCACGYSSGQPSKGLGDTVAKVLRAVGIRKKSGCKCQQRQDKLNELFPYKHH